MSKNDQDQELKSPQMMGFQIKHEEAIRGEDLGRLKAADDLINIVLGEMQYIGKLAGLQKIAPVEDLEQKIQAAYQRIDDYINRKGQALEEGAELAQGQEAKSGPELEKHPLLPELGGMNVEWDKMDKEWMEALGADAQIRDKTEVENKVKAKLQNKIQNALKLANKLQNKPAFKPVQKQVNELVMKYKLTLDDLKNKPILKPEEPTYTPKFVPPRLTPPGG